MSEVKPDTVAQRLVRIALSQDRTMVGLAKEMKVTRQTIHLWKKGEHNISNEHRAVLMAIIGMGEDKQWNDPEEVFNLRLELEETKSLLDESEENLTDAKLQLRGIYNGETEREMKEICRRFADLIDREENRAEEIETLKVDNQALLNRALRAERALDNQRGMSEDQGNEG